MGAIILDNGLISQAIDLLKPDDFYVPSHKKIFSAMISLFEQWMEINPVLINEELKKENASEFVGEITFLTGLVYGLPPGNISHYAKIIKDKSRLRQLIKAASKITNDALDQDDLPEVILERAEKMVFDIATEHTEIGFVSANTIAVENVKRAHTLHDQGIAVTGITSGYVDIDAKTLGWQRGDMIVVAARPSIGKTQLVINFALNAAIRNEYKVAIFSIEMSKESLVNRMLASESRLDSQRVRNGLLNHQEFDIVHDARDSINSRIQINDAAAITTRGIRAKLMRLISEQGQFDLVIVDFLQLMASLDLKKNINREQEVSTMSRELKALAKELNIPLIVVASLNRGPEQRSDHRPQLSDLRESGNIEYAADVVAMLYREDCYKSKAEYNYTPNNVAEIIIAKQRNGPTGVVTLRFDESSGRFDDLYQN